MRFQQYALFWWGKDFSRAKQGAVSSLCLDKRLLEGVVDRSHDWKLTNYTLYTHISPR
jgi:hypothetical protein